MLLSEYIGGYFGKLFPFVNDILVLDKMLN